jgi:hypothetical protein
MEAKAVKEKINEQLNNLFIKTGRRGRYVCHPNICCICDEFISASASAKNTNSANSTITFQLLYNSCYLIGRKEGSEYHQGCSAYVFDGNQYDARIPWDKIFLSPGTRVQQIDNVVIGLMSCTNCKRALERFMMPTNAIANGFYFGIPPECLTNLNEIERAFLSPVKTYGYCFSYTGGCQKELKGTLCYYRVKMSSIARTAAHFHALGMTDNIVILLYGKMTREQKQKAIQKNKMSTLHLMEAITWLCTYNAEWKKAGIDLTTISNRLRNPMLIDNSAIEDGPSGSNIEHTESIQIFFPDSTVDLCTGGLDTIEDFKTLVQQASKSGYNMELQADLLREAVSDYKDNNLVNACIIQFPYGIGGLHEDRIIRSDKTGLMDIESYATHLSRISRPHFHEELFVLILYNMKVKMKMVRGASWRVRQNTTATLLATELNEEDIDIAVRNRQSGNIGYGAGDQLLKAVDAIARGVAHTNEAAKKARRTVECMQHNFGMPTHFLTVTPDDDNSILLQAYSQTDIDVNTSPVDQMDAAEIDDRASQRRRLRIRLPGIAAMAFEHVLDIIIDTVIGWDKKTDKGKKGLFGTPDAYTGTIEEQGRKSLHVHFQIWIKVIYDARTDLHSTNRNTERAAIDFICKEAARTMGSVFFFNKNDVPVGRLRNQYNFPHDCTLRSNRRKHPVVVDAQHLRELRYKCGNDITGTMFATCHTVLSRGNMKNW